MSMADRVAVMSQGEVMQIGTPTDLYSRPATPFIANFVGTSNILKGTVVEGNNGMTVVKGEGFVLKSSQQTSKKDVDVIIRPENIAIYKTGQEQSAVSNLIEGKILVSTYLGSIVRYDVEVGKYQLTVDTTYSSGESILGEGEKIKMSIEPERVLLI